jgi:hypothetical protein
MPSNGCLTVTENVPSYRTSTESKSVTKGEVVAWKMVTLASLLGEYHPLQTKHTLSKTKAPVGQEQ